MPNMPTSALVRLYRIERRMSTVSLAMHAGITTHYGSPIVIIDQRSKYSTS